MAEVVLFHHVRGLTDGVRAFAERLRERGHVVDTPDLFEGRIFATIDAGLDYARDIGFEEVGRRAVASRAGKSRSVVYAGMSMGTMPAQRLLATTPEARGGILLHGFADPSYLGLPWRDDVPVQFHAMDADPWVVDDGDLEAARALAEEHANLEVFTYAGSGHLFTDHTDEDADPSATGLVLERALDLLARS